MAIRENAVIDMSLNEIVKKYGKMVSALCRRMIMDADEAEDTAQEAWIEIINSLPSFKGDSQISTWIYAITKRVIFKHIKKERLYSTRFLHKVFTEGNELAIPDMHPADKKMWIKDKCDNCLTAIVHCLDSEARLSYLFKEIIGLSYKEIAHILEKSETNVRQMISRSKRKITNFLGKNCILYKQDAACNCRNKRAVQEVDLPEEYNKLRETIHKICFCRQMEIVLPRKNYWEKFL